MYKYHKLELYNTIRALLRRATLLCIKCKTSSYALCSLSVECDEIMPTDGSGKRATLVIIDRDFWGVPRWTFFSASSQLTMARIKLPIFSHSLVVVAGGCRCVTWWKKNIEKISSRKLEKKKEEKVALLIRFHLALGSDDGGKSDFLLMTKEWEAGVC